MSHNSSVISDKTTELKKLLKQNKLKVEQRVEVLTPTSISFPIMMALETKQNVIAILSIRIKNAYQPL